MTTATGHRTIDLHPDDTAARADFVADLFKVVRSQLSNRQIAELTGSTWEAVWQFQRASGNPLLGTLQLWAWAADHTVQLVFDGPPHRDVEDSRGATYGALAAGAATIELAHEYDRCRIVARLAAARRWQDMDLNDAAKAMRVAPSTISAIEGSEKPPFLSTVQRYARALGGRLEMSLVPSEGSA